MQTAARILHVDDQPDVAELTATYLEREVGGFEVETATSVPEAMDALSESVDCIVSDYEMPGTDGLEFLETVREEFPDLPFVLYTGRGDEEVASRAISAGATDYLQKQSGTDHYTLLANRVQNAVEQYRTEQDRKRTIARVTDAIMRIDADWEITFVDERAQQLYGVDESELVGENVWELFPEARDTPLETAYRRVMETREPESLEERTVVLDGWYNIEVYPDPDGGISLYFHNVTERKKREKELKRRTERLETLIDNLPGLVYRCENERGWPMTDVDGEVEALSGYDPDDIESGAVSWGADVIHPADREAMWNEVQDALANDEPYEVTYRIVTANDETKHVWEQGRLVDAPDDEPEVLEGFIIDVTDRERHKRELQRQRADNERIRELLEQALTLTDTYVWEWDLEADIVTRYPTVESLFGLTSSDVGGVFNGFVDHVHPDDRERVDELIRSGIESGDGYRFDCRFRNDDGSWQWVRDRGEVITDDEGRPVRAIGSVTDITEQKERERELQRKNERLDQFTSVVSHDLRSPLNVASGRIELARKAGADEHGHLDAAATALERMESLLDSLLALAQEGETIDETETVPLQAVAKRSWDSIETGDATLVVEDDGSVEADETRLQQLFENLMRNAVEHGSTGSRTSSDDAVEHGSTGSQKTEISEDAVEHGLTSPDSQTRQDAVEHGSTSPDAGNRDAVEHGSTGSHSPRHSDVGDSVTVTVGSLDDGGFYVADDGPGIPDDRRDAVFESSYTTTDEGAGLGLAIVEDVATAHGWEVSVTESDDGGARFEVSTGN